MTPKLSIITVNFNNKGGFIKTAESVVAQTWADYEWIIIDGGSTDGSADVIKDYATQKSAKITFWCSERDGGIYEGMNKGIAKASGEYCYFLNSGDCLRDSAAFERFFAICFDEDIVYGNMILEKDDGRYVTLVFKDRLHPSDLLYSFLPHQNMLIKTKILRASNGYRTDFRMVSDWAHYTSAICLSKASYKHIPMALAVNEGGGVSNSVKHWYAQKAEWKAAIREIFTPAQRFCYFFTAASLKSKILKVAHRLEKLLRKRGAK